MPPPSSQQAPYHSGYVKAGLRPAELPIVTPLPEKLVHRSGLTIAPVAGVRL